MIILRVYTTQARLNYHFDLATRFAPRNWYINFSNKELIDQNSNKILYRLVDEKIKGLECDSLFLDEYLTEEEIALAKSRVRACESS